MKGHNFFDDAMRLLGYTDFEGNVQDTEGLKSRAVSVINRILADLGAGCTIKKLSDEILLNEKQTDAAIYGVAMLLALSDGNGEKNRLFAELYNGKRAVSKGGKDAVRDTLPVAYGV